MVRDWRLALGLMRRPWTRRWVRALLFTPIAFGWLRLRPVSDEDALIIGVLFGGALFDLGQSDDIWGYLTTRSVSRKILFVSEWILGVGVVFLVLALVLGVRAFLMQQVGNTGDFLRELTFATLGVSVGVTMIFVSSRGEGVWAGLLMLVLLAPYALTQHGALHSRWFLFVFALVLVWAVRRTWQRQKGDIKSPRFGTTHVRSSGDKADARPPPQDPWMRLRLQARLARVGWLFWPVAVLCQLVLLRRFEVTPELVVLMGYVTGTAHAASDTDSGDFWRYLVTRADPRPRFLQRALGLEATMGALNALLLLLVDVWRRGVLRPESVLLAVAFFAAALWPKLEATAWLSAGSQRWWPLLLRFIPLLALPGAFYLHATHWAGWHWEMLGAAVLIRMAWLVWRLTGEVRSRTSLPVGDLARASRG